MTVQAPGEARPVDLTSARMERAAQLEAVRRVLGVLGNPEREVPFIHVAGTNGKGSVGHLLAQMLMAEGRRVGHPLSNGHEVGYNGKRLNGSVLAEARRTVNHRIYAALGSDWMDLPGAEQQLVLNVASLFFMHAQSDPRTHIRILEAGCGGATDVSNVGTPILSVITNVGLDHCDVLGETVREIAREKAGIIRSMAPSITGSTDLEALREIHARARLVRSPLRRLDRGAILEKSCSLFETRVTLRTRTWGVLELRSPLAGVFQVENIALAVQAADILPEQHRPSRESVIRGVARARWAGRFQAIQRGRGTVLVDFSTNPPAAARLAESLREIPVPRPLVAVLTVLEKKDGPGVVREITPEPDHAVLTRQQFPNEGGWDPREALPSAECPAEVVEDFRGALDRAEALAGPEGTVLVAGSSAGVEDALTHWFGLALR